MWTKRKIIMFLYGTRLYQVLERCEDLFPEWKRENGQFWNSETGEIVTEDGGIIYDLVYRGYKEPSQTIIGEYDKKYDPHFEENSNINYQSALSF